MYKVIIKKAMVFMSKQKDYKETFREAGVSDDFIECLTLLDGVHEILPRLSPSERSNVEMYVRAAFKEALAVSVKNIDRSDILEEHEAAYIRELNLKGVAGDLVDDDLDALMGAGLEAGDEVPDNNDVHQLKDHEGEGPYSQEDIDRFLSDPHDTGHEP